mmetsp:Transcript_25952/g.35721  ORF Transcript_25952/g.35721 Transcript_25952/m.35721 type:complete len:230 (-) Transcript_25952:2245-2934(-)
MSLRTRTALLVSSRARSSPPSRPCFIRTPRARRSTNRPQNRCRMWVADLRRARPASTARWHCRAHPLARPLLSRCLLLWARCRATKALCRATKATSSRRGRAGRSLSNGSRPSWRHVINTSLLGMEEGSVEGSRGRWGRKETLQCGPSSPLSRRCPRVCSVQRTRPDRVRAAVSRARPRPSSAARRELATLARSARRDARRQLQCTRSKNANMSRLRVHTLRIRARNTT